MMNGAEWGARTLATLMGAFTIINLVAMVHTPSFNGNLWWIDVRALPGISGELLLFAGAVALLWLGLAFHLFHSKNRFRRNGLLIACCVAGTLAIICAYNALQFYALLASGQIISRFPISFSLFPMLGIAFVIVILAYRFRSARPKGQAIGEATTVASTLLFCVVFFPLAQMFCFGYTDYSRRAGAIVIFGARVYQNGRMSTALYDRTRTGMALAERGLAPLVICSGGPGDGPLSEPEAMKQFGVRRGLDPKRFILDEEGFNTAATVENTRRFFDARGNDHPSILAVSTFYHLPRVKLEYSRRGIQAYTVPAQESKTLNLLPYFLLREVPAFWYYYGLAILGAQRG